MWRWLLLLTVGLVGLFASPRCESCARDVRGHILRSSSARAEFKWEHPCPATGESRGGCPGYVIDHIEPLACGGEDAPRNMQWQTLAEAKAKDAWELIGCTR